MKLIGIDFGHGETAAYITDLEITEQGKMSYRLHIKPEAEKIFSAFYIKDGKVELFSSYNRDNIDDALYAYQDTFRQAFKCSPLSDLTTSDDIASMETFAQAVYKSLLESNPQIDEHEVFVACPSNWSKSAAEAYLDLINLSGVPARWIISEAHAALEKHLYRIYETNINVLIIDFGSSTIDYVAFNKGENNTLNILGEGAFQYGASMVDIALAESDKVSNVVQDYEISDDVVQFVSRIGKEIYYKDKYIASKQDRISTQKLDIELRPDPQSDPITISYADNSKLEEIQAFEDYKTQIEQFFSNLYYNFHTKGIDFNKVILSGSASQMDFVIDYVKNTFGNDTIELDDFPEYVVCNGIVEFARKVRGNNELDHPEIIAHSDIYRVLSNKLPAGNIDQFISIIEKHPSPEAKLLRAICYFFGIGKIKKSRKKAFDLLSESYRSNNLDNYGKSILAYMYYIGSGTEQNNKYARSILKSVVVLNHHGKILSEVINETGGEEDYRMVEEDDFILQMCPVDMSYLRHIYKCLGLMEYAELQENTVNPTSSDGLHVSPVSEELDYKELMRKYSMLN